MRKIVILAFAFISISSYGQEKWNLNKCINHAYENNIQLKQKQLGVQQAKNKNLQSKLDLLPSFSADASHVFNFGRSLMPDNTYQDVNNQNTNFSVSGGVTLFSGFQKINTLKKSNLDVKSSEKSVEKSKSDLVIDVAAKYLQVLYNIELLNIAKEQLKISKEQQEKTAKLVESGKLAEVEFLKQKSVVSQDELALVEAQNNLDISYIDLFQILDVKQDNAFIIEIPENIIVDANKSIQSSSDYYVKALEVRPEIAKSEIDIERAEKDLSIARGALIPSLSLGAGWSSGYYDSSKSNGEVISFSDQLENNSRKSLSFRLSVPIFNGLQKRTTVRNAKLQKDNAIFEKELAKNLLRKEIQQVYANAKASMKKYYSAKIASEYSKESFDYSQKKYNAGLIDIVSYKEMKKEYVNSLSKLVQAKYDYVFRTKILDYYVGLPISL